MDEGPEREASAKLAQHLAVAVQVAGAVIRLRQERTEQRAAGIEQAAAAARAELTAQHTADRMVWSHALDSTGQADLHELGRAWGAAAGWGDTDPAANVAATRVETRLGEMAPNAMARFDELRESGADRIGAMRDVLAHVAAESSYQPRVFVGEPGRSDSAGSAGQARVDEHAGGVSAGASHEDEEGGWQASADPAATSAATGHLPATPGQVRYLTHLIERDPDRSAGGPTTSEDLAQLSRADASAYIETLGGGPRYWRTTDAGYPHPADLAAESYPRPYVEVSPAGAGKPATAAATATKIKTRTLSR
ncbi:hypothetical protein [Jatrophihabitans lederbergiae]|uniref:DUF222 domain-containing protein n=1 Tax=Jatrophihabitans lederbergiae TaxID=3075547 RepID=A0ABU2JCH9_9ACTN|nr:hypothetical protein [Jatrophihabitans sp. DSM 44399]MDT0262461.1 hypothetical protein [Jatrophihabitans sp. DSM 44399]